MPESGGDGRGAGGGETGGWMWRMLEAVDGGCVTELGWSCGGD